jgi:hypothetical protein
MIGTAMLILTSSFFCFIYYARKLEKFQKEQGEKLFDFLFDMDEAIHRRFDTVNKHLVDLREQIHETKETLSFIEMALIFSQMNEDPIESSRSQAAKEMWKRRRAKRLEKKD